MLIERKVQAPKSVQSKSEKNVELSVLELSSREQRLISCSAFLGVYSLFGTPILALLSWWCTPDTRSFRSWSWPCLLPPAASRRPSRRSPAATRWKRNGSRGSSPGRSPANQNKSYPIQALFSPILALFAKLKPTSKNYGRFWENSAKNSNFQVKEKTQHSIQVK